LYCFIRRQDNVPAAEERGAQKEQDQAAHCRAHPRAACRRRRSHNRIGPDGAGAEPDSTGSAALLC